MTTAYAFDNFHLDAGKRQLFCTGEFVPLRPKTFETLLALVERSGEVLSKDELLLRIWPDQDVEEWNLTQNISLARQALGEKPTEHRFIVTVPGQGYIFVAPVSRVANQNPARSSVSNNHDWPNSSDAPTELRERLEPVGGAVPLDSDFYIARPTDAEFHAAIKRRDSIVLVKGARQVGKTSLLARGLQQARKLGARMALTDFQMFDVAQFHSLDAFFLALAKSLANSLDLESKPGQMWDAELGPSQNFANFIRREVLGQLSVPLIWGVDEVDRLFGCSFRSEVFGVFRSWHNARALDPEGHWQKLTLAMAYATEPHLFITDLNQSPFNVGTRLTLEDFTINQIAELNQRYGNPLKPETEVAKFFNLLGGHPYLARRGLHEQVAHGSSLEELTQRADHNEGPFGDHLRRLLTSLRQDPALCEAMRNLINGKPGLSDEHFYRLRSAGVVTGDSANEAKPRCRLYAAYLKKHLQ